MSEQTENITMEIINSEQFKRANIRFNGKPSEEIRTELKNEGWFYSRNHNVWYPKNDAAQNSQNFAQHIKETYFPEKEEEISLVTETSERNELIALLQNGASINEVLSKISDIYGEDTVHEAFLQVKNTLPIEKQTESHSDEFNISQDDNDQLAVRNTQNGDFLTIHFSDENGWDYTLYDKDYKEIDGGIAGDLATAETQISKAAKLIAEDLYPETPLSVWEKADYDKILEKVEELESEAYDKAVENVQKKWQEHDNGVEQARDQEESREINEDLARLDSEAEAMERANGLREMEASQPFHTTEGNIYPDEVNEAKAKFGDIIRETFLTLTDEERENGSSIEGKEKRYNTWFRPMVDEIMDSIIKGDTEIIKKISDFNLSKETHVEGNKWYSPDEAYYRDVQYKLLPELYETVQEKIKKQFEEEKVPYVIMYSSESPLFPSENKVYTVKEFNELLTKADSDFHNRKKYAEEKYGSADNYWDLERDDKLPEEDKGIQFGYDKTNFKFFNIPNPENPEDTFSYEPSRYDIGDGNGSVFDYVRATCSHDDFITALNALEVQLYYPEVTDSQRSFIENAIREQTQILKDSLKDRMEALDKAQNEYKELHKKWLIEASEADRVDEMLKDALQGIKASYDESMNDVFTKVLKEYPEETSLDNSVLLKYAANEAKKMAVSELYLPSRNAQKAMNAEDYKTYNSIDWAKLRRIWEMFPANVNMEDYARNLLSEKLKEAEVSASDIVMPEKEAPAVLTEEDLEICRKVIPPSQYSFTLELTQGEEGDFFKSKLKEIADTYRKITTDEELINADGTHDIGFRYFLGNTEIFITQIYKDGYAFGYSVLNGDLQMSEWGDQSLEEITSIAWMEMDYHVPKDITVEEMLHKEHPEYFPAVTRNSGSKVSWEDIESLFSDINNYDFSKTRTEVASWAENDATDKNLSEDDIKKETIDRALWSVLDFHNYIEDAEKSGSTELSSSAHEECASISEEIAASILEGRITNLDSAQILLNDRLLKSEVYQEVHQNQEAEKPYNFFVSDTANLDLGVGAEFEAVTGLSAEKAVLKYAELKDKGFSPYIGLNIPGDRIFDDNTGDGAGIFCEVEGKPSFYIGDNFVKGLKENNEHAQNVIAAYKELYEMADKYILGVEKPDFVFEKENELSRPQTPLQVYTFSPFGFEGTLVNVETDLRPGIPAYDIVGIADSAVKETRERIRAAFSNSGLEFPSERVLQSLSPADLRKDSPMDLAMALGILTQTERFETSEPVLALGELELSGRIRPVRGAVAAVNSAKAAGITHFVCDPVTAELLKDIEGISILKAEDLLETKELLQKAGSFEKTNPVAKNTDKVTFNEEWMEDYKEALENLPMKGHFNTVRAIEIAVAGKHNILNTGAPGCGKTLLTQTLMPALTPKLTEEESRSITRINSLAGLDSPRRDKLVPSFRMPHQTATIEGICGGGPNCRPGEISLAHNGTLFMDETAEFRSSVIQMLRVPLESRQITLSRAGRSTSYPADFQLAMAMNPCPCGCYGSHDKICLDSARSIEQYWKKISDPLLDRVEIKNFVEKDEKDTRVMTIDQMKDQIAKAYEIQRKRGVYNSHMTPEQIQQYCKLNKSCQKYFDSVTEKGLSPRASANLLKVSLTIANMDGRESIRLNDLKEANELCSPIFEKPKAFSYNPEEQENNTSESEVTESVHLYSAKYQKQTDQLKADKEELRHSEDLHTKWVSDYEYENRDIPSWLQTLVMEDVTKNTKIHQQELDFESDLRSKENKVIRDSIQDSLNPFDDRHLSVDDVIAAQKERDKIITPVLNGEKTGMWKAFEEFDEHGVFDIRGKELSMTKANRISEAGFKQLQAAMNIYRNKKFETFRYVLVDRMTGEITDQLAISSHMPNVCAVSEKNDDTLKKIISRAEEKDCLVVAVHNHPSGNTEASSYDRETTDALRNSLKRSDGLERFAGHIILDHDSFNLYTPRKGWHKVDALNHDKDVFEKKNNPEWTKESVDSSSSLIRLAGKLNDTYSWNDDFIPVVFTNADNQISGVQYYNKKYFSSEADKIRNDFQFEAMGVGAVSAFPVITESLMEKLPPADRMILETNMKELVLHNAFTDCALKDTTVTEKFSIAPGKSFYEYFLNSGERKNEVHSTWKAEINPGLFPHETRTKKETEYER